jgi:hypothetical protein
VLKNSQNQYQFIRGRYQTEVEDDSVKLVRKEA